MKRPTPRLLIIALALAGAACGSTDPPADVVDFSEDFENGLSQWVGRPAGHHAQIVADPLHAGNAVVDFTETVAAGDLFSLPIPVDVNGEYTLTFDYLGVPSDASLPNNLGGFLGVSDDIPGDHHWLYGPAANLAEHDQDLVEDGQWHTYSVTFVPADLIQVNEGTIHVMLEDGEGPGSLPEDAFFDNIRLTHKAPS
jgi:hypothetical protein